MSVLCSNSIYLFCARSEGIEMKHGIEKQKIPWPSAEMDGYSFSINDTRYHEIVFGTNYGPAPIRDGYMKSLSKAYPSVLFKYEYQIETDRLRVNWICNGIEELTKQEAQKIRKQACLDEAKRYLRFTPLIAQGVMHQIEIMPDGRVAADGENRFGECNIYDWENMKQVSCGNWHTAGLSKEGKIYTCGSNANGQCSTENIDGKIRYVSCGRYHTAILFEDGRVKVLGTPEQKFKVITSWPDPVLEKLKSGFTHSASLKLDKNIPGYEQMNQRIERVSVGERLLLKKFKRDGFNYFKVLNTKGEMLGELRTEYDDYVKYANNITASIETVTPLSTRRKGTKYAAMDIKIIYTPDPDTSPTKKKNNPDEIELYKQTPVESWPKMKRIISIYDAVAGLSIDKQLFIEGYCPFYEKDLLEIINGVEIPE